MRISKVSLQPRIHFGEKNKDYKNTSSSEGICLSGNIPDSLEVMASWGKSAVIERNPIAMERRSADGKLLQKREISRGQIIDYYYNPSYGALERAEIRPVNTPGTPVDRSCTIYYYWEDGKNVCNQFVYDKDGELVSSEDFDRPEPYIDEGSPYANFTPY